MSYETSYYGLNSKLGLLFAMCALFDTRSLGQSLDGFA